MYSTENVHEFQQADEHEYGADVSLAARLEHEQLLLTAG